MTDLINIDERLDLASRLSANGENVAAELVYVAILEIQPYQADALLCLAQLALGRNDRAQALQHLQIAVVSHPDHYRATLDFAAALATERSDREKAAAVLESILLKHPAFYDAWLLLGQIRDALGRNSSALQAYFEAVTNAQRNGQWIDEDSTPDAIFDTVVRAIERVRVGGREILFSSYEELRAQMGSGGLTRVDRALTGYLREWDAKPSDPRQKPRFFYMPDLPSTPYLDPYLQPWAKQLKSSFSVIREEAVRVLSEDQRFQNFLDLSEKGKMTDYLQGSGAEPGWEAYFFYRHGKRFDTNHARCPATSATLESIELCRIADQSPEVCFSVVRPGSHILPHYGVTNVRTVMHLPLLIPDDCALNIVGVRTHQWREGELVMFDDTFQHEAWNRSDKERIVLLMDCWNPHLTAHEKVALRHLLETIAGFQLANRAARAREPVEQTL